MRILPVAMMLFASAAATAGGFPPVLTGNEASGLSPHHPQEVQTLVELIGAKLIGRPYVGGNLGEGAQGIYDQDPLYRLDEFDCTTFVETVLANAFCNDHRARPPEMESCLETTMQQIRYSGESVTYETRNHIAETDWIASNVRRGFLRDATQALGGSQTEYSRVITDKRSWFGARTLNDIQTNDSSAVKKEKLISLRLAGKGLEPVSVSVPYLGFGTLFRGGAKSNPDLELMRRIPNGSVFNLVRENWNPPGEGTPLAVSHQGFIVQKPSGTFLRHASQSGAVREQKLADYLAPLIGGATIRGINVLEVQPRP